MEKDKMVYSPNHYNQGGLETIKLIELMLTEEEFRGYLKGNIIKYRDRAGIKTPDPERDYKKAKWYYDYTMGNDTESSCKGNCCKSKENYFDVTTTPLKEEEVKTVGGDTPIYFVDTLPEETKEETVDLTEFLDLKEETEEEREQRKQDTEDFLECLDSLDEDEKRIIDDYLTGMPNTYIISKHGINKNKLYSILNKNKIPRKTENSDVLDYIYTMDEELLTNILDDYDTGASKASISEKYRLSIYKVNTIIDIFYDETEFENLI